MNHLSSQTIVDSQRRVIYLINTYQKLLQKSPSVMRLVREYNDITTNLIRYPNSMAMSPPHNKHISYLEYLLIKEDELNTLCSLLHLM